MATISLFDLDGASSGFNAARSYQENAAAILLAPNAVLTASGTFSGQTLTVAGLLPEVQIGFATGVSISGNNISVSNVLIATKSGGSGGSPLVFTFNSNATAASVQTLVRNLTYTNTSDAPTAAQNLSFDLAGVIRTEAITVTAVNDVPTIDLNGSASGNTSTVRFLEQMSTVVAPDAMLSDPDSTHFTTLTATLLSRPDGNANESLALSSAAAAAAAGAGLTVGYNAANGALTITGTATKSTYQDLLRGVIYSNRRDNPTITARSVRITASDGSGSSIARDALITVEPINDAPLMDLNGTAAGTSIAVAYVLGDPMTEIAPDATLADGDSPNFNGGTLRVAFTANGTTSDQLRIATYNGVALSGTTVSIDGVSIGSVSGGANGSDLTIAFTNANATLARVQKLLQYISYANTSASPSRLTRQVTWTLNDGDGTANGGQPVGAATATITFGAVTNSPPVLTGDLQATIAAGATYTITSADLSYTDPDDTASGVTFSISNQVNGSILVNGTAAATFTGQQLAAGQVAFRHNGAATTSASFSVSVEDGNEDGSVPVARSFAFSVASTPAGTPLSFATATRGVSVDLSAGAWSSAQTLMPFGDSITNGDSPSGTDEHGYRGYFWSDMVAAGTLFDMVGPNSNGNVPDPDHAGFPGERSTDLHEILSGLLPSYTLDAVLLMVGTNDVLQSTNPQNTVGPELAAMLDDITARNSATHVYVATLLPVAADTTGKVNAVNNVIRADVSNAIADGQNVSLVEMAGFTTADLFDGIHPNEQAYQRIAGIWASAVKNNPPNPPPLNTIGTSVVDVTGSPNNDLLLGDSRSNQLSGGNGYDWLSGGQGDDRLDGGGGDDTLVGGIGNDVLITGSGADKIEFLAADSGHDTVQDFTDNIDKLVFGRSGTGVDSFSDLAISLQNGSVSIAWGPSIGSGTTGNGSVVLQNLTNPALITASDILFIA
ncbi:GDSL-type esterase/lipase family protein [Methylobacterium sp. ID0610]|uniref:GDSL-type esterase/lipase family protein n=1 Tax=Methylobacterium carpenticola TaxID=3344827 RepID=UPI00367B1C30